MVPIWPTHDVALVGVLLLRASGLRDSGVLFRCVNQEISLN
jgi:hypothetical protein